MAVYQSVLDLIGETPIVDVSALSPNPNVRILAKLEGRNPAGSVKDRIAKNLIEAAERDGLLIPSAPDQVLIEPSSGNTGIGLAMVCKLKGYHLKVVMPSNVSIERRQLLLVWGAEIIESPGSEGSNGAVRMAHRLAEEHPEWVFLYQYANPANPEAHYRTTGPEIFRDVPDITHFVAGLGTSGTLMGVGKYLKEQNPAIQLWAIEPPSGEMVDGLRNLDDGYIPPVFTDNHGGELLDRKEIDDNDSDDDNFQFPDINSNDSDCSHSASDISVSDLLEEENDLVYHQFEEQRKIEKSIETYDSNTYLKPLFRSNHILEELYEERVNDDDDEINI